MPHTFNIILNIIIFLKFVYDMYMILSQYNNRHINSLVSGYDCYIIYKKYRFFMMISMALLIFINFKSTPYSEYMIVSEDLFKVLVSILNILLMMIHFGSCISSDLYDGIDGIYYIRSDTVRHFDNLRLKIRYKDFYNFYLLDPDRFNVGNYVVLKKPDKHHEMKILTFSFFDIIRLRMLNIRLLKSDKKGNKYYIRKQENDKYIDYLEEMSSCIEEFKRVKKKELDNELKKIEEERKERMRVKLKL